MTDASCGMIAESVQQPQKMDPWPSSSQALPNSVMSLLSVSNGLGTLLPLEKLPTTTQAVKSELRSEMKSELKSTCMSHASWRTASMDFNPLTGGVEALLPPSVLELQTMVDAIGVPMPPPTIFERLAATQGLTAERTLGKSSIAQVRRLGVTNMTQKAGLYNNFRDTEREDALHLARDEFLADNSTFDRKSVSQVLRHSASHPNQKADALNSLTDSTSEDPDGACTVGKNDTLVYRSISSSGGGSGSGPHSWGMRLAALMEPPQVATSINENSGGRRRPSRRVASQGPSLRTKEPQPPQAPAVLDTLRKGVLREALPSPAPTQKVWQSPATDDADSDSDACSVASDPEEAAEIVVGPTDLAAWPMKLEELVLPGRKENGMRGSLPVVSSSRCLSLGDARRLTQARQKAPLSFGSVVHLNYGAGKNCRPCMFERWAGRCNKSWLCDFCHLHNPQWPRNDYKGPRGGVRKSRR